MSTIVTLAIAVIVALVAYKVLMGMLRIAIIVLIFGVLLGLWQQGVIG
ncbi:MAG: hypothetical protein AAF870_04015 [Pseudomonadota bacterium]